MVTSTDSTFREAGLAQERSRAERLMRSTLRFIRHYPLGAFGAAFAALLVVMAVAPGLFTTIDPSGAGVARSLPGSFRRTLVRY